MCLWLITDKVIDMTTINDKAVDTWEAKYKPIKNHINPSAGWGTDDEDGILFETYGDEFEFVREYNEKNVWTWVDGDNGTYIVTGLCMVNRIGYFITEEPHTYTEEFQVDTYGDEGDE